MHGLCEIHTSRIKAGVYVGRVEYSLNDVLINVVGVSVQLCVLLEHVDCYRNTICSLSNTKFKKVCSTVCGAETGISTTQIVIIVAKYGYLCKL